MKKIALIIIFIFIATALALALAFSLSYLSFSGGQVSPLLEARTDYQKYSSSCRTVENMLVDTMGAAVRRPGTRYVADTNEGTIARLISFEHSTDDSYVIEVTNGYMRFYRDSGD